MSEIIHNSNLVRFPLLIESERSVSTSLAFAVLQYPTTDEKGQLIACLAANGQSQPS